MRYVIGFSLIFILFTGCTRKVPDGSAVIRILAPNTHDKVGSLSAIPSGQKACFAIAVNGPGIPNISSTCGLSVGVAAGFVESGATIQAQVSKGDNRSIDLYLYLENPADNLPCPSFTGALTAAQRAQTYKIGSVTNLSIQADTVDVDITADFPGATNTLAQMQPASCTSAGIAPNKPGFHISSGMQVATGTSTVLRGWIGLSPSPASAAGTGINLKVR